MWKSSQKLRNNKKAPSGISCIINSRQIKSISHFIFAVIGLRKKVIAGNKKKWPPMECTMYELDGENIVTRRITSSNESDGGSLIKRFLLNCKFGWFYWYLIKNLIPMKRKISLPSRSSRSFMRADIATVEWPLSVVSKIKFKQTKCKHVLKLKKVYFELQVFLSKMKLNAVASVLCERQESFLPAFFSLFRCKTIRVINRQVRKNIRNVSVE